MTQSGLNKKVIIKSAQFPPPYGGVSVFNERLYDYLIGKGTDCLFFVLSARKPEKRKYVKVINRYTWPGAKRIIKHLPKLPETLRKLRRQYGLCLPVKESVRMFWRSILISKYLSTNIEYSVLCDHLGKTQIHFVFLSYLGYHVDIHTYLHGSGITEAFDRNPALYRKLINLSSTYIVASKHMYKIYERKKALIDDVRICPPFLPSAYFNDCRSKKEDLLLFIGGFTLVKNPLFLIDELNKSRKVLSRFKMVFIGSGPLEEEMVGKIRKYNLSNVEIAGTRGINETEEYLEKAKYLVLPSTREPFGIVVTEAMAKGVVPIVSNRGGMKENFGKDAGYVFDLEPGALSEILDQLSSEDYDKRSRSAYQQSFQYRDDRLGKAILDILLEDRAASKVNDV